MMDKVDKLLFATGNTSCQQKNTQAMLTPQRTQIMELHSYLYHLAVN